MISTSSSKHFFQPLSSCSTKLIIPTLIIVTAVCIQATSAFMTPDMILKLTTAGRPPMVPHVQGEVSGRCKTELAAVISAETSELLQVVDSFGKPESGLLVGNAVWMGHYDECKSITGFNFCMSYLQLTLPQNGSIVPSPTGQTQLMWGVCVPESCSDSDVLYALQDLLNLVEAPFDISAVNASSVLCAQDPPAPYDAVGFILTMAVIGLLGTLMVLGAFLDTTLRSVHYKAPPTSRQLVINRTTNVYPYQRVGSPSGDEGRGTSQAEEMEVQYLEETPTACTRAWQQFLLCFAVNRNLKKLLSSKTGEGGIGCLNGIRVISMTWVILGHVPLFMISAGIVGNPLYAFQYTSRFGIQVVVNAYFSVDSFFFLSGLLVAYMSLGRMAKSGGKLPWFWFYFHRYWRLTPALGMTTLIWLFLKPYLGSGPVWQSNVSDPFCSRDWWVNLLYINNFYHNDCIAWVWYLANDMQFFIISPILLIMLHRRPLLGLLSLFGICVASSVTTGLLMAKHNFSVLFLDASNPNPPTDQSQSFTEVIYDKPYCRIAPYMVGMAMGYLLHKIKKDNVKLHPSVVVVGWGVATAVGMAVVYGLYGGYNSHPLSTTENAVYMALCRFAWAVSLSWVVFACHYGYGGWINDFLSWELWIPMSRLTYSAYLLHPIVIIIYGYNLTNTYFYSIYTLAFEVAAFIALGYMAAILMAVAIEFPFGNLERMIMPSTDKKTK
ncbi:nose resistant to fluoxetine protein 6-like isoform X1 [Lytechinus pictus]|uniref:nose resistant to fluoxetine protein 6-like isoform X1 n=1 Tax=Lytechinus pictus TaxID=7653 RepID=UPI0030B9B6F9